MQIQKIVVTYSCSVLICVLLIRKITVSSTCKWNVPFIMFIPPSAWLSPTILSRGHAWCPLSVSYYRYFLRLTLVCPNCTYYLHCTNGSLEPLAKLQSCLKCPLPWHEWQDGIARLCFSLLSVFSFWNVLKRESSLSSSLLILSPTWLWAAHTS